MSVAKNYLYNVSYQIFTLIVPLVTTPYITRVLGSTGVGANAYTNSIIQYFILFGSVGVSLYGNRSIAYQRDNKEQMSNTFWSVVTMRFITIAIAYLAFLIFLLFTTKFRLIYIFQSIQIIAAALDISWLFMGLEDFRKTVLRNIVVKLISTSMIFLCVHSKEDLGIYVFVLSASIILGNLSLWWGLKAYVNKPNLRKIRPFIHLRESIVLFIPQISMQIYLVLNKTMLGNMDGVVSAGYYENSDKIVKMLLAVVTAIATVMLPRMANTYARRDFKKLNQYLYSTIDFVTYTSVLMVAGIAGVSPKFAVWFMGSDFAITGGLIAVLSLVCPAIAWSTVIGSQYLVTTNQTNKFTFAVTFGAVLNLVSNLLLIPLFGVMGAVISTVLSEFAITLIDILLIRRQINVQRLFTDKWKCVLIGVVTFALVRKLNDMWAGTFACLFVEVVFAAGMYLIGTTLLRDKVVIMALSVLRNKVRSRQSNEK